MKLKLWRKIYNKAAKKVLCSNLIRHKEPSLIYSPDGTLPNKFLIDLTLRAVEKAWNEPIIVADQLLNDSVFLNEFPGEHYRILKAITSIISPSVVLEIGTYTGMGSLAIMQGQSNGCLYTFDICPWNSFSTHLLQKDFDQARIVQITADLSESEVFKKYLTLLNEANIIFVDAPKDGIFEYKFLDLIKILDPKKNKLLILDDIRFINMIDLWINIVSPKIDITSFGHWSGTGLVDISNGLKLKKDFLG